MVHKDINNQRSFSFGESKKTFENLIKMFFHKKYTDSLFQIILLVSFGVLFDHLKQKKKLS